MPSLIYIYKRPLRKKNTGAKHELLREPKLKKSISIIKSINIVRHNLILYSFLFPLLISYRPRERNQVYFVRPDVISTKSFNVKIIKYYQKNLYVQIIYITKPKLTQETPNNFAPNNALCSHLVDNALRRCFNK